VRTEIFDELQATRNNLRRREEEVRAIQIDLASRNATIKELLAELDSAKKTLFNIGCPA
jgi:hypothetical protein